MDNRRKFQIGLGVIIILTGLFTDNSFWAAGIFLIAAGVFNFCPACRNGSCKADEKPAKSVNPES
ncbi:MAG: hypothetical protein CVV24_14060 [Ignavibacteriae bacterium HGW-Ignavibacteriae-3]|nr:MAG: hypothetical protein CVV24_14060 [Ignavibacteriae bacterium HGW-Ignavibacteriae-3]